MTKTGVYTLLDAEEDVIYIGVSDNPMSRIGDHLAKPWGGEIADWTIEWHETREQGERAERQEIFKHQPRYNRSGVTEAGRADVSATGPRDSTLEAELDKIAAAWAGIAQAEEHYRATLRVGIAAHIKQVEISRRLGRTREMLRRDVMTDEQLAELEQADAARKRAK